MAVKRVTKKMKAEMQELRDQGRSGKWIATQYGVNESLVYNYTITPKRDNKADKINKIAIKKMKKTNITSKAALTEDIIKEIADEVNATKDYVRIVLRGKMLYEPKPKKSNKKQDSERMILIKEIAEQVRIKKIEENKSYEKELEKEKIELKERLGYAI